MSVKFLSFALIAAVASLGSANVAWSAEPMGPSAACAADMAKLCPGVEPHTDAARNCMREHRDQFSPACRSDMEARRKARMEKMQASCGADIAKFCPGAQPGEGLGRCLHEHQADLTDACKAAFPHHRD